MKKIVTVLCMLVGTHLCAQDIRPLDPELGITTIPLYASAPTGMNQTASTAIPTLTVFKPAPDHATGSAIIIAPGGAYMGLASNLEGAQVAEWFAARGFTAFVLKYRVGKENIYPVPILDAQRAIRLVRSFSKSYKISPKRVGIIGFSAGGHLAAVAATDFDSPSPASTDPIDQLSARPDFVVLGYPWLNAIAPSVKGEMTYCSVFRLPSAQCEELSKEYTPKLHVTKNTPPTFIYSTSEDGFVLSALEFYGEMIKAGDSVEMHLFRHGEHGSGLGSGDAALDEWPNLLEHWLRDQGLLTVDPEIAAAGKEAIGPGGPLTLDSPIEAIMSDKPASAIVASICGEDFLAKMPKAALPHSLRALAPFFSQQLSDANLSRIGEAFKKLPDPEKQR